MQELLEYFVKTFQSLYGKENISHNIHNLIHICDDYLLYGPLDNISYFPFENFMKNLKSLVRKHEKPLEQVIHRYKEKYIIGKHDLYTKNFQYSHSHYSLDIYEIKNLSKKLRYLKVNEIKKKMMVMMKYLLQYQFYIHHNSH